MPLNKESSHLGLVSHKTLGVGHIVWTELTIITIRQTK